MEKLHIKFLLANHDGVVINDSFEKTAKVLNLKEALIRGYPKEYEPVELSQIRLICMGIPLLDDEKLLSDQKFPTFDDHPTPINVAIRPKKLKVSTNDHGKLHYRVSSHANPNATGNCCSMS
mmetsp:Transcript_20866/g.30946  ORF Transcript_20866/g.30946 Transcript_20866/m.30946 type:complete len:122 (+) Transcript_20866:177-542(+)